MNTKRATRFTYILLLAVLAFAEKLPDQKPVPLTEVQVLRFENLDLKAKPIQEAVQKIQGEYSALASAICNDAKIPMAECSINPSDKPTDQGQPAHSVTRKPAPAAAPPPVQAPPAKKEPEKK